MASARISALAAGGSAIELRPPAKNRGNANPRSCGIAEGSGRQDWMAKTSGGPPIWLDGRQSNGQGGHVGAG